MVTMIAAIDRNNAIGKGNALPWRIPGDMKFFRETTTGHCVIMGRKTWDSLGGKPLRNRLNIVVSRQIQDILAIVERDIESAIQYGQRHGEVFIIGGGEIYNLALPHADRLLITHVDIEIDNPDTFFPKINIANWIESSILQSQDSEIPYRISEYRRIE